MWKSVAAIQGKKIITREFMMDGSYTKSLCFSLTFNNILIKSVIVFFEPVILMPSSRDRSICSHLLFLHCFIFRWLCSEVGGQHTDRHDRLGCGRSHRVNNGLHAAQELYSLCSFQACGEKVSSIQGVMGYHIRLSLWGLISFFLPEGVELPNFLSPSSVAVRSAL